MEALVFDVNGTLLDTRALEGSFRRVFGRTYSVEQWFQQVIGYSMAFSMSGEYQPFEEIAKSVLQMAANVRGVNLKPRDEARVAETMARLPPFADVKRALLRFKRSNFRVVALSNSSTVSLDQQLRNAGIRDMFDEVFSVDMVRCFKPAREPYQAVAQSLGLKPAQILMVAAHHWDLLGAARAGCRTAFLRRPGSGLLPCAPKPEYVAENLSDLATQLVGGDRSTADELSPMVVAAAAALGCGIVAVSRFVSLRSRDSS